MAPAKSKKRKTTNSPISSATNLEEEMDIVPCWCGKSDHDATVECTVCSAWVHYECLGISVARLSELINDVPANYVCKVCLPKLTVDAAEELKKNSSRNQLYIYAVSTPPTAPAPVQVEISEATIQRLVDGAAAAATKAVMSFVHENLEKEKRKDNLVIVGLPDQEPDEMAQRKYDTEKIEGYCEKLGIPKDAVQSTYREGRQKGKTVLKVAFKDRFVTERRLLLSNGTNLMRSDPDLQSLRFRPFIRPDLTIQEREKDRELRNVLKERREKGEHNLVIRGGRIVPRRPPAPGAGNGLRPGRN